MTISKRMQDAYDHIAPDYAIRNATMPPAVIDIGRRFLAMIAPQARVLDVGCGCGRDMAWMEAQGARVTGIDLSRGMLEQARPHVHGLLQHMNMCRLEFADHSFDGVWCNASLLHVPKEDAPRALAEMHRVLVPDGGLMVTLQEGDGEVWEAAPYEAVARLFARYSEADAAALLNAAGFVVQEQGSDNAGSRHWLHFLATARAMDIQQSAQGSSP